MKLIRRSLFYFFLWIYIITLSLGSSTDRSNHLKNSRWTLRNRYVFVKRWSVGLRQLHLIEPSQWPSVLKRQRNNYLKSIKPSANATEQSIDIPTKVSLTPVPSSSRDEAILPPMDESVVNELSQPNMPTFQEFHAKALVENLNKHRFDDSSSVPMSQSVKENLGGTDHSNLSKRPTMVEDGEGSVTINTAGSASIPSSPTATLSMAPASDIIFPSNVFENGGNGGAAGKRNNGVGQELRVMRNIAASECGAKLLQASPSAKHANAILVNNNDEYMNQPCLSEKWFIIETCEPVQLGSIQIANFELFSSRFKTFRVFVSDRYPAKQWKQVGIFQAQDVKGLQAFHISGSSNARLIKYVKFEMLDHYGNEHFCPITMVRLFGLGSDELDESGLVSSSPHLASFVNLSANLEESGDKPKVDNATSLSNNTHTMTGTDAEVSKKVPSASIASNKRSVKKKSKNAGILNATVDPSANYNASDRNTDSKDCMDSALPEAKSAGLWQHATRFIMNILQSALGGKRAGVRFPSSNTSTVSSSASFTAAEPTSEDFYTVIYLFSSSKFNDPTPPSVQDATSRGLWHLARCLRTLSTTSPAIPFASLAAPHRSWPDCTAVEFLLNLTSALSSDSTELSMLFQRLTTAYQNLTSAFVQWPIKLTGFQPGKTLPVPEFLRPRLLLKTPTTPSLKSVAHSSGNSDWNISMSEKTENEPQPLSEPQPSIPFSQPSQMLPQPPSTRPVELQQEEKAPSSSPPSSTQSSFLKEGDNEIILDGRAKVVSQTTMSASVESLPKSEQEVEPMMTEGMDREQEVVLPAAMGGSWKEAMFLRLNNKVLQLQSDVSVSMRYLEELSQSYNRQTERLSASFNITTAWLKATAKGAEERDMLQQERIDSLEAQLAQLLYILADQGAVVIVSSQNESHPSPTTSTSPAVPQFRKPSSTSAVDLQYLLWSVLFKSHPSSTPSKSPSTPSKSIDGRLSISPAAPICDKDGIGRVRAMSCNMTTDSSSSRQPSITSTSRLFVPNPRLTRLSPQASLLFRQKRLRVGGGVKTVADATTHLHGGDWMFMLVMLSRYLREFMLSEVFRLGLLHVCLAVLTQTLVYVVLLRSALRRCLPSPPPPLPRSLSSSSLACEICSGDTRFCEMTYSKCSRALKDGLEAVPSEALKHGAFPLKEPPKPSSTFLSQSDANQVKNKYPTCALNIIVPNDDPYSYLLPTNHLKDEEDADGAAGEATIKASQLPLVHGKEADGPCSQQLLTATKRSKHFRKKQRPKKNRHNYQDHVQQNSPKVDNV